MRRASLIIVAFVMAILDAAVGGPGASRSVTIPLLYDDFEEPDALVTSWTYYDYAPFPDGGTSLPNNPSSIWETGSGFLYRVASWGYSGRPSEWHDKYFFRLNSRDFGLQNITVGWLYRSANFGEDGFAVDSSDAVSVWLRYQTQYNLYVFQFDRTDNKFVAKRKIPGEGWSGLNLLSNRGVYYTLVTDAEQPIFGAGKTFISWAEVQSLLPSNEQLKPEFPNLAHDATTVYDFKVAVMNLPGGGVQIQAFRAGALIYSATDDGLSGIAVNGGTQGQHLAAGYFDTVTGWEPLWGEPITRPGATGIRADNITIWIDDFIVTAWVGPTDFDGDGVTDLADFGFLQACFGPTESACTDADLNNNGVVNLEDYRWFHKALEN